MKRCITFFLLCTILLTGCATVEPSIPETVQDDVTPAANFLPEPYQITIAIPDGAGEPRRSPAQNQTVYRQADGLYEITTQMLLAVDLNSAVRQLTGFEADQLQIVETSRFSLPEYRFVWYVPGTDSGTICRADLVQDGQRFYAVIFAAPESAGGAYNRLATEVFSTFGLYYDEGV